MKAHHRIEHPELWSADAFAKDEYDRPVSWKDHLAVKFDMQGAIHASYSGADLYPIYGLIYSQPELCDQKSLAFYNREWGWQGVYEFLKKLDI
jgi:hypothetical protein